MSARPSRRLVIALVATAVVAPACSTQGPGSATASPTPSPDPTPARVTVDPADGTEQVAPNAAVSVTATLGRLTRVTLTDEQGTQVPGEIDSAREGWKPTRHLRPSATYTLAVEAEGPDGTPTSSSSTFSTLTPYDVATYHIVYDGAVVGVGMPVSIQFDTAVETKEMRAEVERLVSVKTEPATEGHWGWLDNRQLMWRPKTYWAPGTVVTVDAPITGAQTAEGLWVGNDAQGGFTVGDAVISYMDIPTYTMVVTKNGETIRSIPVSNGRAGERFETRNGTKVIIERRAKMTMDSSTFGINKGDPEYYNTETHWNVRLSWTGEFIHSAPWSVGSQGYANVSHGCTNMSPDNAEWMFNFSKVGDVVVVTGSDFTMAPTDGIGVWQYDYAGWQAQSALA